MSTGRRVVGVVTGMALILLAGAGEVDAYVQYRTAAGTGFKLMPLCLPLPIVIYPDTFPVGETTISQDRANPASGDQDRHDRDIGVIAPSVSQRCTAMAPRKVMESCGNGSCVERRSCVG